MRRGLSRRIAASVALAAALTTLPAVAEAAPTPASGTVDDAADVVTWRGNPPTDRADTFRLSISLPAGTWSERGGVQIGVNWPYRANEPDDTQDLDLYVYDSANRLVAESEDVDEDTESVLLRSVANGSYRVVVRAYESRGYEYSARAEVERLPVTEPVRDLLPDLTVEPQMNVKLPGTRPVDGRQLVDGCFAEERSESGATRCLRFDQTIANHGHGAMEVVYRPKDDLGGEQQMYQRIYRSDDSSWTRRADRYVYHPTHRHFHYVGFAQSRLWRSNPSGTRLESEPARAGQKNGFCLIDVLNFRFFGKGDSARGFTTAGCIDADAIDTGEQAVNGISVGWGDLYNWYLPDQYIDVRGVGDDYYLLETIADPNGTLVETDETNNSCTVLIRIAGNAVEQLDRACRDVSPPPPPPPRPPATTEPTSGTTARSPADTPAKAAPPATGTPAKGTPATQKSAPRRLSRRARLRLRLRRCLRRAARKPGAARRRAAKRACRRAYKKSIRKPRRR
jgi:Lysyl oxidase